MSKPIVAISWRVPKNARSLTWKVSVRCASSTKALGKARPVTRSVTINGKRRGARLLLTPASVRFKAGSRGRTYSGLTEPDYRLGGKGGGDPCISKANSSRLDGTTYCTGYCTWYAFTRRPAENLKNLGNASTWYSGAKARGIPVGTTPRAGAIAWWSAKTYPDVGHVAYVERVDGSSVVISEMNFRRNGGGWNRASTSTLPAAGPLPDGYIYGGPAGNGAALPPPAPDADGDGVPDGTDRCPLLAGPATNGGCPLTRPAAAVAIGRGADGRLVEVGVASNGNIYERVQTTPGGAWSPFEQQPGALVTVAIEANQDGRLVEIGTASTGTIWERVQTTPGGAWGPFQQQPGALTAVAIGRGGDGRLVEFGVSSNGNIYERVQTTPGGAWTPFAQQPGALVAVALEANQDGRLVEAGVSSNGNIYERVQTTVGGAWGPFAQQPGGLANIAVGRGGDGRLVEVGVSSNGNIFERVQAAPAGAWGPFAQQPGALATVAIEANQDGRLVEVGVASNGNIYERVQTTVGGAWGPFVQQPGALSAN